MRKKLLSGSGRLSGAAARKILSVPLTGILAALVLFGCVKSQSESSTQPESLTQSESMPQPESLTQSESMPQPESLTQSESMPQPESLTQSESMPQPEALTGFESMPQPESVPQSESSSLSEGTSWPDFPSQAVSFLTVDDIVFIGDSRTLSMASGGELEYRLLPDSSVFATWGGELTDDSAAANAAGAAGAGRKIAVFWYGINDVQGNPDRDDAAGFRANYEKVINCYRELNPDGDIVILSILTTSVNEKDYYDGQEENIRAYNAELAALCQSENYIFLDLTALFTGEDCFAAGDNIHFSREWYETAFLPAVFDALGIDS